jgi:hypothetical protein
MSTSATSKKDFSLTDVLVIPLNDDLSQPTTTNIIGGVGPFDFSGASAPAAVPLKLRIDTGAVETVTVDISGAVSTSAVTVAELFAAINAASPTDVTASAEAGTGRLKLAYSGAGSPTRLQVYGECAELGLIGQGKGVRIVYSDTLVSASINPILKDGGTFTTTDSNGIDTEVLGDGYRKGNSGTLTDNSMDYLLRSVIEGGTYDETNGIYAAPTSETRKIYFKTEMYHARYQVGLNKEADVSDYIKEELFSCSGTYGERTRSRGFTDCIYNYNGTTYRDSSDNLMPDSQETVLTVAAYQALTLSSLAS